MPPSGAKICPSLSRSQTTLSDSDSPGEGNSVSHGTRGCVRFSLALWLLGLFHTYLLGVLSSFVHGGRNVFLASGGHKRRKLIRRAGSQAAARRGAQPRYEALALLSAHPQVWMRRYLLPCSVSGLVATAATFALEGLRGLRGPRLHLVSVIFLVAWAPLLFTLVFLLSCLIQCCLLVSGYEAPRPAYVVLFPWFQAVLRTLINQDGTTSRIALDEGFPLLISGQSFVAPFLSRTTDKFHKVRFLFCHSLCTLVIFSAALALAARGLSWSCRGRSVTCRRRVFFSTFLHSFPAR